MAQICGAVVQYGVVYSSLPLSINAISAARPDFTLGTPKLTVGCQASNAELMAILMDLETFRNGQPTVNTNHALNPQQLEFLAAKQVSGPRHGIDEHGVYRDPWANPYIITLDLNGDDFCEDPLFGKVPGKVFVWSFGPDGKADLKLKPDEGVNADNIRSDK